jgi:hypothetical protein
VSATISPPIRVFALVGILGATALGAFFFLVARPEAAEDPTLPTAKPTPAATTPRATPTTSAHSAKPVIETRRPRPAASRTKTGYPAKIDRAFRTHRVVVVAVYMPGSSVDKLVVAEARLGAAKGGAAFVPVSALNERVVRQLVAKTGVLPEPAVLVLERPGVVKTTLSVTDRDTIAQAIALARR